MFPSLQNLFIAPCFQKVTTLFDPISKKTIDFAGNVRICLVSSIGFYGYLLMGVAAIVSFVYIVRAGYIMFTAFGDEAKYAEGKKTLLYAIVGFGLSISAYFLIHLFARLLGYTNA